MARTLLTIAVVCLAYARPAAATCEPNLVHQAVVARVTQQSIDAVLSPAGALVPEEVTLPDSTVSFTCGTGTARRLKVNLDLSQASVVLDAGDVVIDIAGDIDAAADVDLKLDCFLPDATCSAGVTAHGVAVHARARITVDQCVPSINLPEFSLTVDSNSVTAHLDDCGGYSYIVDWLQDWLRTTLLDYARARLEADLPGIIQDQLKAVTTELLSSNLEVRNVTFRAQPEWIAIDNTGVTMSFAAIAQPLVIADCARGVAVDTASIDPTEGMHLPSNTSIAVSGRLAQNIITAAWQAGWACLDLSSVAPGIGTVLSSVLPGANTDVTLLVKKPPHFTLVPSEVGSAKLDLADVEGSVRIDVPGDGDYRADFKTSLTLGADVEVQNISRQVALTPREFRVGAVDVTLGQALLGFSEVSVDRFVRNEVAPLFAERLGALPLVSNLFNATLIGVSLDSLTTTQNAVVAQINMTGVYMNDKTPPTTTLARQLNCPCGPELTLTMGSTDDTTPDGFVRHRVQISRGALTSEPQIKAGSKLTINALGDGENTLTVAAIDLAGNVDPDAKPMTITIDATPPVVRFVDPPLGIIEPDGTRVRVEVTDERAVADTIDYTVSVIGRDAQKDDVLISRTQDRGEPLELDGLIDGTTVRLRVIAHDRAGNRTEIHTSFAVLAEQSMGCASTQAGDALIVIVALTIIRALRKRSRHTC